MKLRHKIARRLIGAYRIACGLHFEPDYDLELLAGARNASQLRSLAEYLRSIGIDVTVTEPTVPVRGANALLWLRVYDGRTVYSIAGLRSLVRDIAKKHRPSTTSAIDRRQQTTDATTFEAKIKIIRKLVRAASLSLTDRKQVETYWPILNRDIAAMGYLPADFAPAWKAEFRRAYAAKKRAEQRAAAAAAANDNNNNNNNEGS